MNTRLTKQNLLYYWTLTQQIHARMHLTDGIDEIKVWTDSINKEVIIGIGGSSQDWNEWKSNFQAYPFINGYHRGYYKAAVSLWKIIYRYIPIGYSLVLIGHSRGGAIVQAIASLYAPDAKVIVYGAPKVFSRKIIDKQTFECHNVISTGDVVPSLPWGMKRYYTELYKYGRVKGMEHTNYDKVIRKHY